MAGADIKTAVIMAAKAVFFVTVNAFIVVPY
jgi:hypothetical protein